MATYDYRCPENDRVIEVSHSIHRKLRTWGELCAEAGLEPGDTPPGAPVERLLSPPSIHAAPGWKRQEAAQQISRTLAETPAPAPSGYDAHGHGCYGHGHDD